MRRPSRKSMRAAIGRSATDRCGTAPTVRERARFDSLFRGLSSAEDQCSAATDGSPSGARTASFRRPDRGVEGDSPSSLFAPPRQGTRSRNLCDSVGTGLFLRAARFGWARCRSRWTRSASPLRLCVQFVAFVTGRASASLPSPRSFLARLRRFATGEVYTLPQSGEDEFGPLGLSARYAKQSRQARRRLTQTTGPLFGYVARLFAGADMTASSASTMLRSS